MSTRAGAFYKSGGTLAGDAPSYVTRRADADLLEALVEGDFCYVLTSRQMGKSSLVSRCRLALRDRAIHQAVLDLQRFGTNLTVEQWVNGLLNALAEDLDLEDEIDDFLDEHPSLSPHQTWMTCLRQVVLEEMSGPLVIFVDEIDIVRALPFATDEFFAGIRELYNRRASDPELKRLTFCLLGVASPADLIHDKRITPFNIGKRIELLDFTASEMEVFADGLQPRGETEAKRLVERVYYWTAGQPYLSQRLCQDLAETPPEVPLDVDGACRKRFLSKEGRDGDPNLTFVRDRLLVSADDREPMLQMLKAIVRGKRVPDDASNIHVGMLKLSGAVSSREGTLRIKNRIYAEIFDRAFIKHHMPVNWQRVAQRAALWLGGVFLFACLPVAIWALKQRSLSEAALAKSEENYERSLENVAKGFMSVRWLLQEHASPDEAQEMIDRLEQVFESQPDHERKRFTRALLLASKSELLRRRGQQSEREALMAESVATLRDLYQATGDVDCGLELASALNASATMYLYDLEEHDKSRDDIRAYFDESLQLNRDLMDQSSMGPWLYSIGLKYKGDMEGYWGNHEAALSLYEETASIRRDLAAKDGRDLKMLRYLNESLQSLAHLLDRMGRHQDAAEVYGEAADALAQAGEVESKNYYWPKLRAETLVKQATATGKANLPQRQRDLLEQAVAQWAKLSRDYPMDRWMHHGAARSLEALADVTDNPNTRLNLHTKEREHWRSVRSLDDLSKEEEARLLWLETQQPPS